ncbi:hypothetical protein LVJ82_17180 [Vitreoscilla massiliensis]|uniref:Uncharacterized protein n=1 Tax=Vitreoscilla massiliensis TaxID=1689272 RepID=A0ABY4E060_9NEIS|nr:hypothetical protein [Vitreoscilla massiliensis]UOO89153.1 hypothetical protein LVJ82_17180 [Vitreoscilla massiliensis]
MMQNTLEPWFQEINEHAESPLNFLPNGTLILSLGEDKCAISGMAADGEYMIGFTGLKEKPTSENPSIPNMLHFGIHSTDIKSIHSLKKICESVIALDAEIQSEKKAINSKENKN